MKRDCYPLEIHLPDGTRAEYVANSRPPRYTVDGQVSDIDVVIPDDLAAVWFWFGAWLCDGDIRIFTGTYGVSGAFEQARTHMYLRQGYEPPPIQLYLFEVAA